MRSFDTELEGDNTTVRVAFVAVLELDAVEENVGEAERHETDTAALSEEDLVSESSRDGVAVRVTGFERELRSRDAVTCDSDSELESGDFVAGSEIDVELDRLFEAFVERLSDCGALSVALDSDSVSDTEGLAA